MAKTVEITTTQNVVIEYELAGLRDRMLAMLLDLMITVFGTFMLLVVLAIFDFDFEPLGFGGYWMYLWFFAFMGYHICFELMNAGRSLGKSALGIRVVRLDGKDPRWSDIFLRAFLYFADLIGTVGLAAVLLIKTTPKAQRLGDIAAHTTVVKTLSALGRFTLHDILNISTLESYQPQYPQVRQLTDQDMIIIKRVLARYMQYPNDAHRNAIAVLAERLATLLDINMPKGQDQDFLRTLLRDYIVLTR
jgi:uncharacterized RDD family membrane protein YckC